VALKPAPRPGGHPAVHGDFPNQVVAFVRHIHVSRDVHRHACGIVEGGFGASAIVGTPGARTRQGRDPSLQGDFPDSVVEGVGNVELSSRSTAIPRGELNLAKDPYHPRSPVSHLNPRAL